MTGRFIDFDAARAERADESLLLRAYGQTFELPGSMPASVLLDIVRLHADLGAGGEIPSTDVAGLLRSMLPGDVLDVLLERADFSTQDLEQLLRLVMQSYMASTEASVGEASAPSRKERRSKAPAQSTRPRGSRAQSPGRQKPAAPGTTSSSTGS